MQNISIYEHTDYKSCIRALLEETEKNSKGQKTALSQAMRCQPAYLSRVLNGDAHLSFEQAEAACRFFTLNKVETSYLLSLIGVERSGTVFLKEYWIEQKSKALKERTELKNRIKLDQPLSLEQTLTYYSAWYYSAIHVAVSVPHLRTADAIASYFGLPTETVKSALEFLCSASIVQKKAGQFFSGKSVHLDKNQALINKHHLNWKMKSLEALTHPEPKNLHYSSIVSISKKDFDEIKEILLKAVESVRKKVGPSKEEMVACYSLELFELAQAARRNN